MLLLVFPDDGDNDIHEGIDVKVHAVLVAVTTKFSLNASAEYPVNLVVLTFK
jgi:hypothetical protein